MSSILKKSSADKIAFKYNPKPIHLATSEMASTFVSMQTTQSSDFQMADIVAAQTGVSELRKKNLDAQVEESVLDRLKEIEERAYKQAYDLGLIEGTDKAFEEMRAVYAQKLLVLDEILAHMEQFKSLLLKENETILVNLIFQIAQKIAMREITLDQGPIVKMLNELVLEVQTSDAIQVRLCPSDMQFVDELRQKNVKAAEPLQRVKLVVDDSITPGGCIVETNFGSIESTIEQRTTKAWTILAEKIPVIRQGTST